MPWQDWIPLTKLRILFRYLIVDAAVLLVFRGLTLLAWLLFPKDDYVIVKLDFFGLVLLIVVLLVILIKEMGGGGSDGSAKNFIYA